MLPVELDLSRWEDPLGSDRLKARTRGGEDTSGQVASEVPVQEVLALVVGGVVGVDEDRVGLPVVVVLVVVLLNISISIHRGLGSVLAAGGDMVPLQDPDNWIFDRVQIKIDLKDMSGTKRTIRISTQN